MHNCLYIVQRLSASGQSSLNPTRNFAPGSHRGLCPRPRYRIALNALAIAPLNKIQNPPVLGSSKDVGGTPISRAARKRRERRQLLVRRLRAIVCCVLIVCVLATRAISDDRRAMRAAETDRVDILPHLRENHHVDQFVRVGIAQIVRWLTREHMLMRFVFSTAIKRVSRQDVWFP